MKSKLKAPRSKIRSHRNHGKVDQKKEPHIVHLGGLVELTDGAGRQYVDGRKDSERQ